jgi:hypothetical protein
MKQPPNEDADEYHFLTSKGAHIDCRLASISDKQELELFGNREGLLSLANIFLWLVANAWRREFLSLGELDFIELTAGLVVCIRLSDDDDPAAHGILHLLDKGESLEWVITEEGLQQVALWIHRLVSCPSHEYDYLLLPDHSYCGVHIRIKDAFD